MKIYITREVKTAVYGGAYFGDDFDQGFIPFRFTMISGPTSAF